eukprot:CAMPEP_0202355440 /NCGR_PEP_ID=MMETSP1126-20121109/10335_1 /ASSEMBLY_ACC=CAM_ASM_000457 /TAXON_ID=3047 /ORGANISM="Dunaliella tertiolecta, Strain CCMP1320" /LENGTH=561 /DNA_ID=CAMNT_0048948059 /DNA_START=38 /DNA_END=1723 /DNA_ORIENTATION=+
MEKLTVCLVLGVCLLAADCARVPKPPHIQPGREWNEADDGVDQHQRAKAHVQTGTPHTKEAEAHRVSNLPGFGPLTNISMFAGYESVGEGRHLYYTFVESSRDAANDPVVLWLNGGPGCSSVGGGFLSELGAFLPKPDGKTLQGNPYAWNKIASTLFVDSPAFVGWSYSENPEDATVGDARTSTDLRAFLLAFMERFPHLKENELYFAGESYAGHYVPNLAWTVVQGNQAAGGKGQPGYLNLAGIMVGNPWTDASVDNKGAVDYWWSHALIGDDVLAGINENCDFSRVGPLDAHPHVAQPVTKEELCDSFCDKAFYDLSGINIYHIYADVCPPARVSAPARALAHAMQHQNVPLRSSSSSSSMATKTAAKRSTLGVAGTEDDDGDSGGPATQYDACIDNEVEAYLNQPDVQRALHANITGKLPGPWQDCSLSVIYSREDLLASMLPVWHNLLSTGGLRFLVYSGDVDGIVPVVGTRRWVSGLGLQETEAWRPWTSGPTSQVGGYTVAYATAASKEDKANAAVAEQSTLVFATVRGAGHMVPYTQPQRALHLVAHFLNKEAL